MADVLATPVTLGDIDCANRVFMAPLTRARSGPGGVPTELMAQYYSQRAGAGLIISEGTNISEVARGFDQTPGIYDDDQVAGWRIVTDAVHAAGGTIVCQLWHTGRVSHADLHPPLPPVSATAGESPGCMAFVIVDGRGQRLPASPAAALDAAGIRSTVEDYARAAANAMRAGFDGVEIHAANGYLLHQFLAAGVNLRSDEYGGSPVNRARLLGEVAAAVAAEIGPGRVGVRLSPLFTGNGIVDDDPVATFQAAGRALAPLDLAFLHLADSGVMAPGVEPRMDELLGVIGDSYAGAKVLNGAFDGTRARAEIESGRAAAIAFGRAFLANPDLPARLVAEAELNPADRRTFYGGGAEGYTDYPTVS